MDVEVVFDSGTAELGMYGVVMVVVSNSPIYTKVRKHLFVKGILFKKKSLKYLIQPTFRGCKAQAQARLQRWSVGQNSKFFVFSATSDSKF